MIVKFLTTASTVFRSSVKPSKSIPAVYSWIAVMASSISEIRSFHLLSGGMDSLLEDIFFQILM